MVSWKRIKENQETLSKLFCSFGKVKLKAVAPDILINEIKALKCYSPYTTKNQMGALKTNIETFETIEQEYSSLDNFITHTTPANVIKLLADSNSTYKLKYAGVAIICEYLRNVGIDIIKPDVHIKMNLAKQNMAIHTVKQKKFVLPKTKKEAQILSPQDYDKLIKYCFDKAT